MEIQSDTEEVVHENFATGETEFIDIILKGKGDIDWSKVKDEYLDYDDGYGSQVWSGWVSFTDGTWIERHEYDGSEWWEYKKTPSLKDINKENEMNNSKVVDCNNNSKPWLVNLKENTLDKINRKDKTVKDIKEYFIKGELTITSDTKEIVPSDYKLGEVEYKDVVLCGRGEIDWSQVEDKYLNYYNGAGDQVWYGWILFNDNTWIERCGQDGYEGWEDKIFPNLENEIKWMKELKDTKED